MNKLFKKILKKFLPSKTNNNIAINTLDSISNSPFSFLILSSTKDNQNYYRDMELARQTRSIFLTELFDYKKYNWSIKEIIENFFKKPPDFIFINYINQYTPFLLDLDGVDIPIIGFVGDHYNFIDNTESALHKKNFFKKIPIACMVSAYPHTNNIVSQSLGNPNLPFIYLPWAISSDVFRDIKLNRKSDIACMGAMTQDKYPFRNIVRNWLENQKDIKLYKRKRAKGKSDHDAQAFNLALNKCYAAFTCASSMNYTLMKYFEIPAAGNLLFAETTEALNELGFEDRVHYIAVNQSNYKELITYYLKGEGRKEAEAIRTQGYSFIHKYHTWEIRIKIFLEELEKLGIKR